MWLWLSYSRTSLGPNFSCRSDSGSARRPPRLIDTLPRSPTIVAQSPPGVKWKLDAVGELAADVPVVGGVEQPAAELAGPLELDGHGPRVVAQGPDHVGQRMRAPAADEAVGVVQHPVRAPAGAAVLGVRPPRGGAEPQLVVQPFRHGDRLQRAAFEAVARRGDDHLLDFAQPPVADQLAAEPDVAHRPLLRAVLEDAPVALDLAADRGQFLHAHAQRFFHVHVLARADGQQGGRHVPVVGRADGHRVDVVAGEHLPQVAVGRADFAVVPLVELGGHSSRGGPGTRRRSPRPWLARRPRLRGSAPSRVRRRRSPPRPTGCWAPSPPKTEAGTICGTANAAPAAGAENAAFERKHQRFPDCCTLDRRPVGHVRRVRSPTSPTCHSPITTVR